MKPWVCRKVHLREKDVSLGFFLNSFSSSIRTTTTVIHSDILNPLLKQTERYQKYTCCSVFISLFRLMEFSSCTHSCVYFHWPLFYLVCPVPVVYTLVCMFYIASHTHSLSFLTIKVLTHFFQVYCLHKSFSLSLPLFSPHLPSFSEENLNMSWRDQSPDIDSTASLLLIFSPLLYFSSNCLIRLLLSTIGCPWASIRGFVPRAAL